MIIIRASRNESYFLNEFESHLDSYTRICSSSFYINRWFQSRIDLIGCLFACTAVYLSILGKGNEIF